MKFYHASVLLLLLIWNVCFSQTDSLRVAQDSLKQVIIKSNTIPIKLKYATESVSLLTTAQLNQNNGYDVSQVLNQVPGIFMQSGALNTNRISIRGIGARNSFGTVGIRAYFGDIPLTNGNAESAVEDFELASVSSIEVYKGPSASSYGVGLGGTLLLQPIYKKSNGTSLTTTGTFGSFGLERAVALLQYKKEKVNLNLIASRQEAEGYRENNTYDRLTLTTTGKLKLTEQHSLSVISSLINLTAFIPSSLSATNLAENPTQAAFTWGNAQGFEDSNYFLIGTTWDYSLTPNQTIVTSVFGTNRTNYEPRPFNILDENSHTYGVRSRYLFTKKNLSWTMGAELFRENYDQVTYQNLYEEFPAGTGSVKGSLLDQFSEIRYNNNAFAEVNINLTEKLILSGGINLNKTSYEIENKTTTEVLEYDFDYILSPKLGLNYSVNPQTVFYGNVSHGFSPPTSEETLLPQGSFNPDISPERGWNLELGTSLSLLKSKLNLTASVYRLWVDDLLVSRRTALDEAFAINAGQTLHTGIETLVNLNVLNTPSWEVSPMASAAFYLYEFEDFQEIVGEELINYNGNQLTGVPQGVYNVSTQFKHASGIFGNVVLQHVGEIPVNDMNTVFSDSYSLINTRLNYKREVSKPIDVVVFFGINNMFDTNYVSQLQVNARGFGGNEPRYFYPGLPRNYYVGIQVSLN
ncbi:TonB-dependent receptor [Gangjinia marincola]|uniref:TonB-dependent receptor n=1 Tax=Gangjinia marincola TaxID=578463 RepID=A0ABP3XYB5_9FLAO